MSVLILRKFLKYVYSYCLVTTVYPAFYFERPLSIKANNRGPPSQASVSSGGGGSSGVTGNVPGK